MDCRKERVGTGVPERSLFNLSGKELMLAQTRAMEAERIGKI